VRPLVLLTCLVAAVSAQPGAQAPAARPTTADDTPIFRLSVSLVQLDAVVTDGKGRHVTTLGPDDFEVFQDGRRQPITAVSYVELDDQWTDTSGLPPLASRALRPADARRTVGIVVDDLRMSFESIYEARRGLGRFIDRDFRAGDAAMLTTTSGVSRLSQLTSSASMLKLAVGRLRYSLWGVRAASALDSIDGMDDPFDAANRFQERTFAASTIMRIEEVVDALKRLPGRKSVVLVSEGFQVFGPGMDNALIRDALQGMVDRANRAGVVIYAVDPRGLVPIGISAADNVGARQAMEVASMRSAALRDTQDGLRYVAGETGGFAVVNTNDLAYGFRKIMADQRGYYLIGYQPEAGTVNALTRDRFRHISIKVKRKGLKIRTRAGFYGRATE
jgi:VWFA-related protein